LVERPHSFTSREVTMNLRLLLGDGLLTIDGDFHRQQRRLVQPAFHKRRVESYAALMVCHTRELLDEWQPGAQLDIARAMQELTLRIVAKALFDVDLREQHADLGQAFTDIIENPVQGPFAMGRVPLDLPFTPYGKNSAGRRRLDAYVYGLIARRRAAGGDVAEVLSMLLAAQDGDRTMPDRELRDQARTLFAAGHEPTANALSWAFFLLSQQPRIMERLQDELRIVLAGRAPTVDDLPRLQYLDWVVLEAMRLY